MSQALSMREKNHNPALETIQANSHELHAARVVQLLVNMDRIDVDAIIGIATQQLHQLCDLAIQKTLPKYLIHKKEEAAMAQWRARPNGPAPTVRVLAYNEVIARSGDYRPTDELPDYHLRRVQAQREQDLQDARNTAAARARLDEVNRAANAVAQPETPVPSPPPPEPPQAAVAEPTPAPQQTLQDAPPPFDLENADKPALTAWVEQEFNYGLDAGKPIKQLRDQARELVRQRALQPKA